MEVGTHQVSQPLHVGGRHFPIDTRYLDSESVTNLQSLPDRLKKTAKRLSDKCNGLAFTDLTIQGQPVPNTILNTQLELAAWLVRIEATEGGYLRREGRNGAVLIFVPGTA